MQGRQNVCPGWGCDLPFAHAEHPFVSLLNPAGQARHGSVTLAMFMLYFPTLQALQNRAPCWLIMPSGHGSQSSELSCFKAVDPLSLLKVFRSHFWQAIDPASSLNQPPGQTGQALGRFTCALYVPTLHGLHVVDPRVSLYQPSGHSSHRKCSSRSITLSTAKVPLLQARHATAPEKLATLPPSQTLQPGV